MLSITIKEGWKQYCYQVEYISIHERTEYFKVQGRNGHILIESNRLLFRNKGLKKRRPDFKVIEGQLRNIGFLERMMEAIYSHVEQQDNFLKCLLIKALMTPIIYFMATATIAKEMM